ncbi:MAG TPA: GDP-mannose 4,6-dehydratase [Candidatus Dormibacteraeota bacterium]|nr:GDP-mannose 4,6-dehydratase [Candidatus Dormibacteraeota bacterium]
MKLQGRRVLVTGGAGFIGSHVVELLACANRVTVLDDFSVGRVENLAAAAPRVRIVRGDVTDRDLVTELVREAEVVVHMAVVCLRESIGDPLRTFLVNDLGTLNVLLAARGSTHLERLVYVSSSEVYGSARRSPMDEEHPLCPMTPYAASKLAGEVHALSFFRTYGLPVVVVRPFNAYGPRSHLRGTSGELIPRLAARALAGRPLVIFGDGSQTRDFTWVGDVARGIALAAECDALLGNCVNIARGEPVSVLRVAELIRDLTGAEVPIEHHPARPGDVVRHHADVRRGLRLLGFRARTAIEEGLARYLEWLRGQPGDPASWLDGEEVVNWHPGPIAD